ncbi:hypothetical protein DBV15_10264 [Temnothorax longispinosus]|uniref:Uncharacterized protein n=1 Tax=Temnothorax longispinosus TaxID=300112 RepID=A0A4V3SBD2_9HYME|nr:hypothetical protein DBV15_10264 [Temnothorax longispinosus]
MGSFPVAVPDIASRAEFVRSQLEILRLLNVFNFAIEYKMRFKEIATALLKFKIKSMSHRGM